MSVYSAIPDWPRLRARYEAFWRGEARDGCILAQIQNPNPDRPAPEPWMREGTPENYLDPKKLLRLKRWRRTAWNRHVDLFPYLIPSYGPNVFAGFAGGRVAFGADTVWHEPVIENLGEADELRFDEENPYWKHHLETIHYFGEQLAGVEMLGMTDFGGPADWISTFLPVEEFLLLALEEPEAMAALALRLARECNRAFDLAYARIGRYGDGVCNWMPLWSDGPVGTVQDDIAINVSPELYAEVFLPALRVMAGHTPRTVLHWHDGCAHHLDAMLAAPEIDCIQYGHDPNMPPFTEKIPEMKRIQAAGKKLFISCVEAHEVEPFLRALDPRGLMMIINTADDEASRRMGDTVRRLTTERMGELGLSGA